MHIKFQVLAGYLAAASLILAVLPTRSNTLPHMQNVRLSDNVTPPLAQSTNEQLNSDLPVAAAPETAAPAETVPVQTVPTGNTPVETTPAETKPARPVYEIPEDALFAPKPNKSLYGETDDPDVLEALIAKAEPLLDGQTLYFSTRTGQRMPGSKVHYYLDDSIVAILWKEVADDCALTMAEVKLAHPSQFRRHLSGEGFGSVLRYLTSEMSAQVNAVVATSADFYGYRDPGVVVVDGVAKKMNPGLSDACYINDQGDLIIEQNQPFTTVEELQSYVDENNIRFSLSFGPALVKDGVALEVPDFYPVGEIYKQFARAGICQMGKLHYLSVTANFEGKYWATMTVKQFADVLVKTGCTQAYTLDGGQTATITLDNKVINFVNYGAERRVSDILYFATAIPEQE